jgi:hypothetical protein
MPDMAPNSPVTGRPGGTGTAQPPMGVSQVTGPTPNRGYEAAGLQRLGMVVKTLTEALPLLGAGSDAGQAVLKALSSLSKFVPSGAVTPAAERNNLESMMMRNQQQNQQLQAARQGGGGGAGAMPGMGGGGAPPGMPRAA